MNDTLSADEKAEHTYAALADRYQDIQALQRAALLAQVLDAIAK